MKKLLEFWKIGFIELIVLSIISMISILPLFLLLFILTFALKFVLTSTPNQTTIALILFPFFLIVYPLVLGFLFKYRFKLKFLTNWIIEETKK